MTETRGDLTLSKPLRGHTKRELDVPTPIKSRARRERLSAPETTRVSAGEIDRIASIVILPDGVTDVRMSVLVTPGDTLPNGTPSGLGSKTVYGPVWVIRGREESGLIHEFEHIKDGLALYARLTGEEGELWNKKRRRAEAIAAAEAAEEEAASIAKDNAKTVRRANEAGDGSTPRRRFKGTTSHNPLTVGRRRK